VTLSLARPLGFGRPWSGIEAFNQQPEREQQLEHAAGQIVQQGAFLDEML